MSAATDIEATVAVLRALRRREPVTFAELALVTELPDRRVRRIVDKLEAAQAPIVRGERDTGGKRPASTMHITVDGLREWLG